MTDRPIIFSAPMVRAILEGRKTQTRRVIKAEAPAGAVDAGVVASGGSSNGLWWWLDSRDIMDASTLGDEFRCPYGVPGDRLYVRENFRLDSAYDEMKPTDVHEKAAVFYEAGGSVGGGVPGKLRPSIHLPRWASRLVLPVVNVRVERLQDITEADARAEGVFPVTEPCAAAESGEVTYWLPFESLKVHEYTTARGAFAALWRWVNGPKSWDANPWVWTVEFLRDGGK